MTISALSLAVFAALFPPASGRWQHETVKSNIEESRSDVAHVRFAQSKQESPSRFVSDQGESWTIYCGGQAPEDRLARAKAYLETNPPNEFRKFAEDTVISALGEMFIRRLSDYYGEPTKQHLEKLALIVEQYPPDSQRTFVVTHFAAALGNGLSRQLHDDVKKSKVWSERALRMLEGTSAPPEWIAPEYTEFRNAMLSELSKYLDLYR